MEQRRPHTSLSWMVTLDTTAKRPVVGEAERRVIEGRACPLKSLHRTWGSGYQPSEVHCAQKPSPWMALTWILGFKPSPVGRYAHPSLHNHQGFHQKKYRS